MSFLLLGSHQPATRDMSKGVLVVVRLMKLGLRKGRMKWYLMSVVSTHMMCASLKGVCPLNIPLTMAPEWRNSRYVVKPSEMLCI